MFRLPSLALLTLFVALGPSVAAQESAKVKVTVQVPAKLDSFKDQQLEILLYEFDPRIADKAATQLDKQLKPFTHASGKDTAMEVTLGTKAKVNPKMRYYVTVFILDPAGKRTHIGEKNGKAGLCHVLTDGHPDAVKLIARPVR